MIRSLKTAAKITAFAGAFALTGCAFVPVTVHAHYQPPANLAKMPGADKVTVYVIVKNENKTGNRVSSKKDGFNISMAGVYMHVAKDFKAAITKALARRGFHIGEHRTVDVKVIIKRFYLPEQEGLVSQNYSGFASIYVTVYNLKGDSLYKNEINVADVHTSYLVGGASRTAKILMSSIVNKLVNDNAFISALMTCVDGG
ncbi:YajG family lipoprotein [Acidithiobacillus caldus]